MFGFSLPFLMLRRWILSHLRLLTGVDFESKFRILVILLSSVIGVGFSGFNTGCVGLLDQDGFLLWVLGISFIVYFPILPGLLLLL